MAMNPDNERSPLEEAASWHVRLLASDTSEADWLAFEQWLSSDAKHGKAYDQIEKTWAKIEDLPTVDDTVPDSEAMKATAFIAPLPTPRRHGLPFSIDRYWGTLAVGLAIMAIALAAIFWPSSVTTYQTAKGETKAIDLPDGTKIRLNSGSVLKVALGQDIRQVTMDDAEASFDVARDPGRPFVVAVGDRTIRVVGTEFNILHHDGRLTVTLRRGSLDVLPLQAARAAETIRLSPGQQLTHDEGETAYLVQKVNADNAFAWQNGHLIYHDASLGDVLSDLNRYFSLPLRADKDASALKFSGVLTVDTENAVVQRLEAFLPVDASRSETEIVLRRKSPH